MTDGPGANRGASRGLSRRALIEGLAAVGVAALVPWREASAQTPASSAQRLDLHHHFGSPRWITRATEVKRQGWQQFQDYTPAKAIEAMDKGGVQTAFVSCTEPGIWFGDDFIIERHAAIAMARDMNEYGARMAADYKGRFALFAVLPLPDIDASLREIEYAFDTLHAEGVGLLTSYGNMWLGDRRLQPVFDELNRRRAIVYSHPTDAPCCHSLLPNTQPGTVEWNTDTSRAIYSMIAEGIQGDGTPPAAARYSNITFIWSHGGGTLLGLVGRFGVGAPGQLSSPPPNSRLALLRRFYYDTAGSANPVTMQGLKQLVGSSRIVFGSDFPYGGASPIVNIVQGLHTSGLTATELRGIDRENALEFLPKYRNAQ